MIRSRWTVLDALAVTIKPPFGVRAKATTARSISPASRTLIGVSSTPRGGDQFRCGFAIAIGIVCTPADFEAQVAAIDPAQLLQSLLERCDPGFALRVVGGHVHQHTDPPHRLGLLRAYGERPQGGRAAD